MERLRPRNRPLFSGFTNAEIEKMEKVLRDSGAQSLNQEFCQKMAASFNRSSGRAGKPIIKWIEEKLSETNQSWNLRQGHQKMGHGEHALLACTLSDSLMLEACIEVFFSQNPDKDLDHGLSEAFKQVILWSECYNQTFTCRYDVEIFVDHRFLSTGEPEVLVRFVGYGAEYDEWVNIKKAVRERSVPFEHTECSKLKAGDLVLCLQERRDQAIFYDAHIVVIKRKMHDIRGCRCLFVIRYNHDNCEEQVRLIQLCWRPNRQVNKL